MVTTTREWLEDSTIQKMKRWCAKQGNNGIRDLVRRLRAAAATSSDPNFLAINEVDRILQTFGIRLTPMELNHVCSAFNGSSNAPKQTGRKPFMQTVSTAPPAVDLRELANAMVAHLPPRRRAALNRVLAVFDMDSSGNILLDQLQRLYKAEDHPLVVSGRIPEEEAHLAFKDVFNLSTNPEGVVPTEEFLAYYAGVSQNIPDDEYFERHLAAVWGLQSAFSKSLTPGEISFGTILDARRQGKKGELSTSLTIPRKHPPPKVTPELQACYASYGGNNRNYDMSATQSKKGVALVRPLVPTDRAPTSTVYETSIRSAFRPITGAELLGASMAPAYAALPPAELQKAGISPVEQVKALAYQRGGRSGIRGLIRMLRVMDDNGNRQLDKYELQSGLHAYGLKFTSAEMDELMCFFDRDGSGQISITEFQRALRGPPNPRRLALIRRAYDLLDINGDEQVTMDEICELYDVSHHPDVAKKEKTSAQAMEEFVRDWDKNGDQVITRAEFEDYYADLSAGIDDDDYFELMIRNAWHISGGVGICANTSCRRVLVCHTNGRQTVEEIRNDLRIRATDIPAMIENLRQQGIDDVKEIFLSFG